MQYRKDKKGNDISILGYGCMRFSRQGIGIDLDKAQAEVKAAIEGGVNYLDTAYIYPGNETAVGEILHRLKCRNKIYLATKLPHYMIKSMEGIEKTFREQLRRLQTDYIDYYLMHMLTDTATWEKLKRLGIETWIREKLSSGQIRNIGFSYHGNSKMFKQLVDAYDWDFCQIQYNYLDEHTQAGREGLLYAAEKQIPVIIMEPLRGGKLVDLLPDSAREAIHNYPVRRSPAEWAFRWLWDQPEVTCVLSGMNSQEMVAENTKTASEARAHAFTEADHELIETIKASINQNLRVGCTGCGYCMPCPHGVDIPTAFRCYNKARMDGRFGTILEYIQVTSLRKDSSDVSKCIQCGACEQHCPQHIEIRRELQNARKELQPFYARTALRILKKLAKIK